MILYAGLDRLGFRPAMRTVFRMEIAGSANVPADGPAILVANHESIWDPFVLGVLTRRPIRYMAKAELWRHRAVGRAMDGFGAFPVERGGGDLEAMRRAIELLEAGEVLGVFPQGTSKVTAPRRWHRGAARLALLTGAPIVPVRLTGTRGIVRRGLPRLRVEALPPIVVEVGRPTIAAARALMERVEAVTA